MAQSEKRNFPGQPAQGHSSPSELAASPIVSSMSDADDDDAEDEDDEEDDDELEELRERLDDFFGGIESPKLIQVRRGRLG